MSDSKECTRCKANKPATLEYFRKKNGGRDGLNAQCRSCEREYEAETKERRSIRTREYYAKNKERITEAHRAYYEKTRGPVRQRSCASYIEGEDSVAARKKLYRIANKERDSARAKARYLANREQILERHRTYRVATKERRAEVSRAWRAANKVAIRAKSFRRRAMKRAASGTHTHDDIKKQYQAQKGLCYYCKVKVGDKYHVDHVIPLSRGGSNGPENIVIACPTCNLSKMDKMPHEWAKGNRLL